MRDISIDQHPATVMAVALQKLAGAPKEATPLLSLSKLAAAFGLGQVLIKNEAHRPLGSFKALGGLYASLQALSRVSGLAPEHLLSGVSDRTLLPPLICASDGNHGLAVAAAARLAGTTARVFLPAHVAEDRARRLRNQGAEVIRVVGTYDDAVVTAALTAKQNGALLIADTSDDADDPVVADVVAGYGVIAREIRDQLSSIGADAAPTHLFIQAGVGGFAAAMVDGLHAVLAPPARIILVEPASCACVAAALHAGRPVHVGGDLATTAEMLSCGEASAPAFRLLRQHRIDTLAVTESDLTAAPVFLTDIGGPATTSSGAAGLAGLRVAHADSGLRQQFELDAASRVLLFVTETTLAPTA